VFMMNPMKDVTEVTSTTVEDVPPHASLFFTIAV
jgi:hypothetical protein